LESGKSRIEQKGLREKLLGDECEGKLSVYERQYSLDVVVPEVVAEDTLSLSVDYGLVKLCILSVLWRASVSTLDQFSEVSLGLAHEDRIAGMLLEGNPAGELDYGIRGHVVLKPGTTDQIGKRAIAYPSTRRDPEHGYRLYGFIAAGVMWSIFVTAPGHGDKADITLNSDGTLLLRKAPTPENSPLARALSV